jgi:hypothetical protein
MRAPRRSVTNDSCACLRCGAPSCALEVGMSAHPGRTLSVMVIAAVALAIALGLVLAVDPAAQPVILLVGVVASLILYGVMYVVERRRHW